jgi:hypothetical protein
MTYLTKNATVEILKNKYNLNTEQGQFNRRGVAVLADRHHEFYYDETNSDLGPVVRWISSDNIVPGDILEMAVADGVIQLSDLENSLNARKIEDEKFIAQYVANRQKYGYSDEEKFEMMAAFGGEEVVDIFTGKTVQY